VLIIKVKYLSFILIIFFFITLKFLNYSLAQEIFPDLNEDNQKNDNTKIPEILYLNPYYLFDKDIIYK